MAVLDRFFKRTPAEADALMMAAMARPDMTPWSRSVHPVKEDQALAHSAVWGSATLISDLVGSIDYKKRFTNPSGFLKTSPIQPELLTNPSDIVSPIQWRTQLMMSVLLRGSAFGWITAITDDGGVEPTRIELIDPHRVQYRQPYNVNTQGVTAQTVSKPGQWTVDNNPVDLWPVGKLVQLAGYTLPGKPMGISVLQYGASGIGLGIAAEAFGRDWFTDGAHPSGILQKTDGKLTAEQADEAKSRWRAQFNNRRDPAVLGGTWDYKLVQIANEDSQFLETINYNVGTVCRFFRMPPELIGASTMGGSITYASLEGRLASLLTFTVQPWVNRVNEFYSRLLAPGTLVQGDTTGFVTPDALTAAKVRSLDIQNGVLSPNEALASMGKDPYEGGDVHNWPPMNKTLPASGESDETLPPGGGATPFAPGANLQ